MALPLLSTVEQWRGGADFHCQKRIWKASETALDTCNAFVSSCDRCDMMWYKPGLTGRSWHSDTNLILIYWRVQVVWSHGLILSGCFPCCLKELYDAFLTRFNFYHCRIVRKGSKGLVFLKQVISITVILPFFYTNGHQQEAAKGTGFRTAVSCPSFSLFGREGTSSTRQTTIYIYILYESISLRFCAMMTLDKNIGETMWNSTCWTLAVWDGYTFGPQWSTGLAVSRCDVDTYMCDIYIHNHTYLLNVW